ncbi:MULTISPECIES: hypothetical protein [Mesorhizobium]|nr:MULTISPECIES: hypothetical protein [Mesorhizobium]
MSPAETNAFAFILATGLIVSFHAGEEQSQSCGLTNMKERSPA